MRGNNQQIIFEDEYDYMQFISILKHYKEECFFKLYAYCLMDNHIHLLIEHTSVTLDVIMKRIEVKFVRWYNHRYQRIGTLFQDRYRSEPINDSQAFRIIFRYIHQNPLHAGLEQYPGTYLWSTFQDYCNPEDTWIDIDKMIQLFSSHQACIQYLQTVSRDQCLDYLPSSKLSDAEALKLIQTTTALNSPSDFQHLDLITRNYYLSQLAQYGISIRQLSRLTGISRTAISSSIHSLPPA